MICSECVGKISLFILLLNVIFEFIKRRVRIYCEIFLVYFRNSNRSVRLIAVNCQCVATGHDG